MAGKERERLWDKVEKKKVLGGFLIAAGFLSWEVPVVSLAAVTVGALMLKGKKLASF